MIPYHTLGRRCPDLGTTQQQLWACLHKHSPPAYMHVPQALDPRYHAVEQALLLAWATHVKKGTSQVCGAKLPSSVAH